MAHLTECGRPYALSYGESPITERHAVDDYVFGSDGSITSGPDGPVIAFIEKDHRTVKSDRHGRVLAYIDNDGTIKPGPYSTKVLGHVDSDGTVKADRYSTKVLGKVSPPHVEVKAALLLVT